MNVGWVLGSADVVRDALAELFRTRGVESVRDGEVLRFPARRPLWANGAAYRGYERTLQIDVRLGLGDGRTLIESVAGFGTEDGPAITDGLKSFERATLPVLLAAFFDQPHVAIRERWEVGGRKRVVAVGEVTTRFGFPLDAEGEPDIRFFDHFKRHVEQQPVPPGTHWVRLYQMQHDGKSMCNEVLLDNDVWPEMQTVMESFDWPVSEKTYDVRVFLVMRDA
jgi:hypothetical protein